MIAVVKWRRRARSQSLEDGSEQIVGRGGMQDVALRDVHPVSRRKAGQRWTEDVHRHHRHGNGNGQRSNRLGDRQDMDDGICLGR